MRFCEQTIKTEFTFAIAGRTSAILKKDTHTGNTCFTSYTTDTTGFGSLDAIVIAIGKNFTNDVCAVRENATDNFNFRCGYIRLAEKLTSSADPVHCNHAVDAVPLHGSRAHSHAVGNDGSLVTRHTPQIEHQPRARSPLRVCHWFSIPACRARDICKTSGQVISKENVAPV